MMRRLLPFFFIFMLTAVFAQEMPLPPAVYYGKIYSPCGLDGAVIEAVVNGQLRGSIQVIPTGTSRVYRYGGPYPGQGSLPVGVTQEENGTTLVEFILKINGNTIKIGEDVLISGSFKEKDFNLTLSQCNVITSSQIEETTSGGGGRGTSAASENVTSQANISLGKSIEKKNETVGEVIIQKLPIEEVINYAEVITNLTKPSVNVIIKINKLNIRTVKLEATTSVSKVGIYIAEVKKIPSPNKLRGKVLKRLVIEVDESTKEKLKGIEIEFFLPKTSVEVPQNIRLAHWKNEQWILEPTEYIGLENGVYKFRAKIGSLSHFAIVELQEEAPQEEERPSVTGPEEKPEVSEMKTFGWLKVVLIIAFVLIVLAFLWKLFWHHRK